ncbi:MAG: anti-sigma factor family protein [Gemmatimonadales bacterium]
MTDPIHLDDREALALVHGELAAERGDRAGRHLTTCEPCRVMVERIRREEATIARALAAVDYPAPKVDPGAVGAAMPRPMPSWTRWAAVVLFALSGAGVAAAVPGSPVNRWVRAIVARVSGATPDAPAARVLPTPVPEPPAMAGGVEVAPGERLVIQFARRQDAGSVTIRLNDAATVAVRAPEGAASFTSGPGRLTIDNGGRFDFEVTVPRGAARVEVLVGADRVFLVTAGSVVSGPPPDSTAGYRIPLGAR